ncbi:MAG: FAD-dependent monooxygenase [Armatimonadetes bacterium]|nr:FAD-dependent monooxygenase [Armatimonadota bacterium]
MDAVVVGAGPVGMMMACELHRQGLSFRIVDLREGRSAHSKALAIWSRSLEALHDLGLAEKLLAAGHRVHGVSIFAEGKRVVHLTLDEVASPFPYALIIPQSRTEQLLEEHLQQQGLQIEWGVALKAFEQDQDGVVCQLAVARGVEEVRSRWLIGCDGAESTIRQRLGIEFRGKSKPDEFVLADARALGHSLEDEISVYWHRAGVVALFPMGGELHRVIAETAPGSSPEVPSLEQVQHFVDARTNSGLRLEDPTWLARFRSHERHVRRYHHGRVFLAGDAAHVHSPIVGQGLNTGLQDVYNLGWKLALVRRHGVTQSLLDSYSRERSAVGEFVRRNAGLATQVATLRHPVARYLRDRMAAFLSSLDIVQERMRATMTELDINYRKSPLSREHIGVEAANWHLGAGVRPGDRAPDGRLLVLPQQQEFSLFRLFQGTGYRLLLFQGAARTPGRFNELLELGKKVTDRFREHVRPHLILRQAHHKPTGPAYLDPGLRLHKTYGAGTTCLYLIRPDGYVGYRSLPCSEQGLFRYLDRFAPKVETLSRECVPSPASGGTVCENPGPPDPHPGSSP